MDKSKYKFCCNQLFKEVYIKRIESVDNFTVVMYT